jgi:hypothetical protein
LRQQFWILSPEKREEQKGMVEILSFSSVKARFSPPCRACPRGSRTVLNPLIQTLEFSSTNFTRCFSE